MDFPDDLAKFIKRYKDELKATILRLEGKEKTVRYSNAQHEFALNLWNTSPKAYETCRDYMVLPSTRTILLKKSGNARHSGSCPEIYWDVVESMSSPPSDDTEMPQMLYVAIKGILSNDEMKTVNDYQWSTITGLGKGFCPYQTDMSDLSKRLSATGYVAELASYSNQWLVQSCFSKVRFPLEFFFSHKGASATEIEDQFYIVLNHCKSIGIDIVALISDAGTGTSTARRYLSACGFDHKEPDGVVKCADNTVSMPNPMNPENDISLPLCTVHGGKNMRGALFSDKRSLSSDLLHSPISVKFLRELQHREAVAHESTGEATMSRLKRDSLYLNSCTKMNVNRFKNVIERTVVVAMILEATAVLVKNQIETGYFPYVETGK